MVENNTGTNPPIIRVTWSMSRATALKITVHIYIYIYIYIYILYMRTHTYTCTFHDVYCSKPWTFPKGFMLFLLLVAVASTFADFKPLQLRPRERERKMSITRSGRQQRMCHVWYMIRKGTGRQSDNNCYLTLIILSKNKACDCYCHQVLINLSKKNCNCHC